MTRLGGNGSAGRVLVVEDDEGIREMLKYNLVTAGFSVHEASDGASGPVLHFFRICVGEKED